MTKRFCGKIGVLFLTLLPFTFSACGPDSAVVTEAPFEEKRIKAEIDAFCGACHQTPQPELFPSRIWVREVERGYGLYTASGRTDLNPPPIHEVVEYYRTHAPQEYNFPQYDDSLERAEACFETQAITPSGEQAERYPAISCCRFFPADQPTVVYGDMRSGEILMAKWSAGAAEIEVIGTVANPAGIDFADVNGDGRLDILVADLGNFLPAMDHLEGAVYWFENQGDRYTRHLVAENLGRVADVRAADFNQDGRQDLIVAEFGWRKSGHVLLFQQQSNSLGEIQFSQNMIDSRHGAIHVPVVDANGDRWPDFVGLFSQEYESVELFLGRGDGSFEINVLHAAEMPSYGSTGIELVDLDQDGDTDVLWTNGDAFDATELRPYHQVQWLENDGEWNMQHHALSVMPGAHRAIPVDLDRDGDLDIATVALLPNELGREGLTAPLASAAWFEQTSPGEFERHLIQGAPCQRATLTIGDVDEDGWPDIVAGEFQFREEGDRSPDLMVWRNRGN